MSRYRGGEALLFVIATALILVHALDDAFVHRGPGLGIGQHALAAGISAGACFAAVLAFPSLRPGLRSALAFAFGGLACVNGAFHLSHVVDYGPAGSDLTGVLAVGAGALLLGLAVAIPWRHRGRGTARGRAVAVPAALVAVVFVVGPIGLGVVETHKWREPIGASPGPAYQDVAFRATDGLDLAGWYRPSQNGAAVLLVHGGAATGPARSHTPRCSCATDTACCCTTRAAAARATAPRTTTAGTGARTWPARSPSSSDAVTSTPAGSAPSASRPAPTS
jgi:hypothetical protein